MIAKLVTHAPTRAAAVAAQARALDEFTLRGIRHNIDFLGALMAHPRWQAGHLSTSFIAEEFPEGFSPRRPEGDLARRLAAVAAAIDARHNGRRRGISGQLPTPRPVVFARDRVVQIGGTEFRFAIDETGDGWRLAFDDGPKLSVVSAWRPGDPVWRGTVEGDAIAVQVRPVLNGVTLSHAGAEATARVYTRREAELVVLMPQKAANAGGKRLLCPMPGVVTIVWVTEGQEVKVGEALAVVEAMKMENVLRSERDGTVKTILVRPGDILAIDAVILDFA